MDRFIEESFGYKPSSKFKWRNHRRISGKENEFYSKATRGGICHAIPTCTAHRECNHSTAHQCQDGTGNARSLQTGVPCSVQIERPKGGLSEQGDTGTCRLRRPQVGWQAQQPLKFRGEHRAPPSGGVRWGHREMEEVINRRKGGEGWISKDLFPALILLSY